MQAFYLPFTLAAHRCVLTFTDKTHGSFCYELVGSVLPPSVLAEHQLSIDLNNLAPVLVPLTTHNAQLDAARKLFMDAHPLAKDKEQLALAKRRYPNGSAGAAP